MVDPLAIAGSAGVVGDRSGHAADLRPRGSRPQLKRTEPGKVLHRQMPAKGPERRSKNQRQGKLSEKNMSSNQASRPIIENGKNAGIAIAAFCAILIQIEIAFARIVNK